jgi:hypothetical protein
MPQYQHDCSRCKFIRPLTVSNKYYDVYRCPSLLHTSSWIARYGDEGGEYWSMPWDVLKGVDSEEGDTLLRMMQSIAREYE